MAKSKDGKEFSLESNFIYVVSDGYYVDKTLFIKDLLDGYSRHRSMLITRPRRFGKSLNLSMIRTFFEKTEGDNSVYFKDLEIWRCGEKYTSEQGKYPVICLDFKDVKCDTYEEAISKISPRLSFEFSRHKELMSDKSIYTDTDLLAYDKIVKESADVGKMEDALLVLSRMLYTRHGVKPIILVDEYDVPIQYGYEHGYYTKITEFFGNLFSAGLKGNDNMTFAVITGAMRIAKASIFTGLNNLGVYSVMSERYSQYFGFTKEEVTKILNDFRHPEKMKEICDWYDGYRFGNTDIFNPWSVSHYVDADYVADTYWLNSSENSIIKDLLKKPTDKDVETLRGLLSDVPITGEIKEDISYGDLNKKENDRRSAIYSVMLATGYLTPEYTELGFRHFVIPNEEVKKIYREEIITLLWGSDGPGFASDLKEALATRDAGLLEKTLQKALNTSASYHDFPKDKAMCENKERDEDGSSENQYHAFVDGLSLAVDDVYMVRSNEESGLGRFDMTYLPRNISGIYPGVIIEFETAKSEKDMDTEAEEALAQIEDKMYDAKLKDAGVTRIDKYAMVFFGKKVKVVKKEMN